MADLNTLIADLKAADGPSRELDAEIALAAGWVRREFSCSNSNGAGCKGELWFPPYCDEEDQAEAIDDYREAVAVNRWPDDNLPIFTASIDAAMMLASGMPEFFKAALLVAATKACNAKVGNVIDTDLPRYIVAAAFKAQEKDND